MASTALWPASALPKRGAYDIHTATAVWAAPVLLGKVIIQKYIGIAGCVKLDLPLARDGQRQFMKGSRRGGFLKVATP